MSLPFHPQPKPEHRVKVKRERRRQLTASSLAFRNAVWKRDGNRCRHCGRAVKRGHPSMLERGEVHHITPRSKSKQGLFDPRNGVVLCVECHSKAQRHEITVRA